MRIILDECIPRALPRELRGHIVTTVPLAGLSGYSNGRLLARIEGRYDALITMDGSLPAQQSFAGLSFGVLILQARSNRLPDLKPMTPRILDALTVLRPGQALRIA